MNSSVLEPISDSLPAKAAEVLVAPWPATPARPLDLAAARRRMADYVELTKPRITLMALITVAVGAFVAARGSVDPVLLAHTLLGTGLVAAGASVLNQVLERDTDARMRRTQNRPLPAGRVRVIEALAFGIVLSLVGTNYVWLIVNPLAGLLATATLVLYVFAYTPMKRWTSLNTAIGAVPGALPPVIGWAAVRGSVPAEAWTLFLIVFLWQFPHFLAIAWMYREDYARAGLKMLPVGDPDGTMTARQMIVYSLALLPMSLAPSVVGLTGPSYFVGAVTLGLMLLGFVFAFVFCSSQSAARNVMRASLVYLPTLLILMMLDLTA